MKKHLIYLCMASLLGMTACEDDFNKENFKGLDEMTAPQNVLDKDYTLTEADYTTISALTVSYYDESGKLDTIDKAIMTAVKTNQYLTSASDPRVVLPVFLAKNWKTASLDATLRLTFNYVQDVPAYLTDLAATQTYELTADDYKTVWGEVGYAYLSAQKSPKENLPAILKKAIAEATEGEYVIATYQYSDNESEVGDNQGGEPVEILAENFAEGQGNFTLEDVLLPSESTYVWKADNNGYMKASAYVNKTNYPSESWLVSPALDMSGIATATLTFEHVARFGQADHSDLTLWVSVDYESGLPSTATWTSVPIPTYSSGEDWTFVASGDIILDDFAGNSNVHFAFKYTSTAEKSATWEIKNVVVNGITGAASGGDITYEEGDVFAENFADGQGEFVVEDKTLPTELDYVWSADTKYHYMKASAFKGNAYKAESWLISPAIALTGVKEPVLTFEHAMNKGAEASYAADMTLWISVVGSEDWQQLTIPNIPKTGSWNFIESGEIDLSAYVGKSVKIAFKYQSTTEAAATWELKNVAVSGFIAVSPAALKGVRLAAVNAVETRNAVYAYDGKTWAEAEKILILNPADYKIMGAPEKGYFSTEISADNYLPRFLNSKYPYAQESDTLFVIYNYSNKTTLKADEYVFADGAWKCTTQPVTAVTEQYALTADGWVYSPDVVVVLKPGRGANMKYFQALTDWVWNNVDVPAGATKYGEGYVTSYGNNDYYFGGSEYQNNFDFRPSAWRTQNEDAYGEMSDEELTELMWERLPEGIEHMLDTMYPDMVQTDEPISYVLKFGIYGIDGSSATKYYSIRCKLVGKGKFSYVEGSLKEISGL